MTADLHGQRWRSLGSGEDSDTVWRRLGRLNWLLVLVLLSIGAFGIASLYSAADGNWRPWALQQAVRFGMGLCFLLAIALIDLRVWRLAAYPVYAVALFLLIAVEFVGVGDGAQRWIDLGFMNLQPSEVMKLALIMALARYFHDLDENQINRPIALIVPLLISVAPVLLILRQPDLGTATILVSLAVVGLFLGGLAWWKFVLAGAVGGMVAPLAWGMLHEYQRERVLTFLEPERDPLGAGYHIVQSKIALGSGGAFGKGFMEGSQAQLSFLPEKHTDFIFTLMAEEFGFFGSLILLLLYVVVMYLGYKVSSFAQSVFARVLVICLLFNFFLYAFINMAMVMGLMPVVGVPLPLVSYGGTAMLTLMIGFGLIQSVAVHGHQPLHR